eukprot:m.122107 g.122107  ORF g.122107 m.122107 type:complete len:55 (-) comp13408_c0_seq2:77-241(-)
MVSSPCQTAFEKVVFRLQSIALVSPADILARQHLSALRTVVVRPTQGALDRERS